MVCGNSSTIRVEERDLATGHIVALHWFCRRHRDHADQMRRQIAARGEPAGPPMPNTGGWLARYFASESLERLYQWALPDWTPPTVGLCRDDWTVSKVALLPRRPRLALVVST
jgi:hypothetical protein